MKRLVLGSQSVIPRMTEPELEMQPMALGASLLLGLLSHILEPLFLIPGPGLCLRGLIKLVPGTGSS
jgi:uncharacterized membrane protein YjjB (DUF3815 family)